MAYAVLALTGAGLPIVGEITSGTVASRNEVMGASRNEVMGASRNEVMKVRL